MVTGLQTVVNHQKPKIPKEGSKFCPKKTVKKKTKPRSNNTPKKTLTLPNVRSNAFLEYSLSNKQMPTNKNKKSYQCQCHKHFQSRSGFWRHVQTCEVAIQATEAKRDTAEAEEASVAVHSNEEEAAPIDSRDVALDNTREKLSSD